MLPEQGQRGGKTDHQQGRDMPGPGAHGTQNRHLPATFIRLVRMAVSMPINPVSTTNSKISTFALQREINDFRGEPMMAILPGVALQELWSLMRILHHSPTRSRLRAMGHSSRVRDLRCMGVSLGRCLFT